MEFYISKITEKCRYFDIPCKQVEPETIPYVGHKAGTGGSKYVQNIAGRQYVKIKLESAGGYDIQALNVALAAGKKVKLVICE